MDADIKQKWLAIYLLDCLSRLHDNYAKTIHFSDFYWYIIRVWNEERKEKEISLITSRRKNK